MTDNFRLSKALSWVLRHGIAKKGLTMTSDGYVLWDDLAKLNEFSKYTFDDIKNVVETNDKKRFALQEKDGQWFIRANQGHSGDTAVLIDQKKIIEKIIYSFGFSSSWDHI